MSVGRTGIARNVMGRERRMASPQIENGYIRIANELLAALCKLDISGPEFMVALTVISRTYGWNKKEDSISISQFQKLTQMTRPRIVRAIKNLVRYSVLGSTTGVLGKTSTYWIIKDYGKWSPGTPSVLSTPKRTRPGTFKASSLVRSHIVITKDTTKDNLKTKGLVSPTRQVQEYFYKQYKQFLGVDYVCSWAKDGKLFKDMTAVIPLTELLGLVDIFFKSDDPFVAASDHGVGVFKSQINRLRAPKKDTDANGVPLKWRTKPNVINDRFR